VSASPNERGKSASLPPGPAADSNTRTGVASFPVLDQAPRVSFRSGEMKTSAGISAGSSSGRKPEYIVGNQMIETCEKNQNRLPFLRKFAGREYL
jgi:hypothetical protein